MSVTLMSWIVVQVAMIGYVSWMQPVSFVASATLTRSLHQTRCATAPAAPQKEAAGASLLLRALT